MKSISKLTGGLALAALVAMPATATLAQDQTTVGETMTVIGTAPADLEGLPEGPEVEGIISARSGDRFQVTTEDGTKTVLYLSQATKIKSNKGLFGLASASQTDTALLNGLPVSVKTVRWGEGLVASRITFKGKDLKVASMIHNGTDQRFTANEAATEALRGRVANIDKYNVVATTNVYFDTGKWAISESDKAQLCQVAQQAEQTENALMLVVGYTDSVGDEDYNQELSDKRAGKVMNYLQQACGWEPYRMLTPTGMAESDPAADNSTEEGKAQNRRVSVNILVSKAVEGMGG